MPPSPHRMRKLVAILLGAAVLAAPLLPPVRVWALWPHRIDVVRGQPRRLAWSPWVPVSVVASGARVLVNGRSVADRWQSFHAKQIQIEALGPGRIQLTWRAWGWLPFGETEVESLPPQYVLPGGQAIGVVVHTQGLVVSGWSPVHTAQGLTVPAQAVGIQAGEILLEADGHPLTSDVELNQLTQVAGLRRAPLTLEVAGPDGVRQIAVTPAWGILSHRYRLGLLVQSQASGVGTLTLVLPGRHAYAALGHSLTDGLTAIPAPVLRGQVFSAKVVGVKAAQEGKPGEKIGVLERDGGLAGSVSWNGRLGVGGVLSRVPSDLQKAPPMPVALPDQVHPGPASLWTVLAQGTVAHYRIEILRTFPQDRPMPRGIIFKVTDPRLIAEAGGVIQGMSGSPIVQDGRLVGAVTHVVVGNPQLGYGCYAWWMVQALRSHLGTGGQ